MIYQDNFGTHIHPRGRVYRSKRLIDGIVTELDKWFVWVIDSLEYNSAGVQVAQGHIPMEGPSIKYWSTPGAAMEEALSG